MSTFEISPLPDAQGPGTKRSRLATFLRGIEDIPTLPHVVIELLDKIEDPEASPDELADLIMVDQVLATKMIRMVNSAFWGLRREVNSVRETIVLLGLRNISALAYSATLANTFERDAPLMQRVRFWEHAFGCALFSRLIAQRVGYPETELAYLAGLLHDIGESIIALHAYRKFEAVVRYMLDHSTTFFVAEERILGFNHTDLGPWLTEKWLLPAQLSDVITYHHSLPDLGCQSELVTIVRLADLVCLHYQLDFGHLENEALETEMAATWGLLLNRFPRIARTTPASFLAECESHIEVVKQTVEAVYQADPL